ITIAPTIQVRVAPQAATVLVGKTQTFTATVQNDQQNAGATWSLTGAGCTGAACGTLSANSSTSRPAGTYSAPTVTPKPPIVTLTSNGVITVTAVSIANTARSATATIGITDLQGVYTYHNNAMRDGKNILEFALTPANVQPASFGKLFSCPIDGAAYTQPLWV